MIIINELKKDLLEVSNDIRRELFEEYSKCLQENNLLIMGIRQIGKTTIAKQLAKQYILEKKLVNSDYLYLDLRNSYIRKEFSGLMHKNPQRFKLVVIDEIQLLENWNDEIQIIIDRNSKTKFIITGSNSMLLKKNSLVGRAIQYIMKPLSYNEYKQFWLDDDFDNYINFGSFPRRSLDNQLVSQNTTLSEQVIKDVVREDLKSKINIDKFILLASKIINHIGNEVRVTKLTNNNGVVDTKTGKEYLDILISSEIIKVISNESRKDLNSKYKKLYFTDLGLINFFNEYKDHDANISGKIAENAVFNFFDYHLNKKYDDAYVHYFKEKKEIDFIINSLKLAIEVKYSSDKDYLEKGVDNLIKFAPEGFRKIIITKDINEEDIIKDIKYISLKKLITEEIKIFSA